jgi:integrase
MRREFIAFTPLILFAANTGLRRGELLQLRWRDVSLEQPMLTVRGEGAKTGMCRLTAKL